MSDEPDWNGPLAVYGMQWQPISSAPKDGSEFIAAVWWDDSKTWEVVPMKWHDLCSRFGRDYAPFIETDEQPSMWQPMPPPPIKGKEA